MVDVAEALLELTMSYVRAIRCAVACFMVRRSLLTTDNADCTLSRRRVVEPGRDDVGRKRIRYGLLLSPAPLQLAFTLNWEPKIDHSD